VKLSWNEFSVRLKQFSPKKSFFGFAGAVFRETVSLYSNSCFLRLKHGWEDKAPPDLAFWIKVSMADKLPETLRIVSNQIDKNNFLGMPGDVSPGCFIFLRFSSIISQICQCLVLVFKF